MAFDLALQSFLANNRIPADVWTKSSCDWPQLQAIARDHEAQMPHLRETAEFFARVVQKLPHVHSVRWRVKDTEHLLEKIVRKRAEGNAKYSDLSQETYFEKVTDLVGLRALHLFKDDCFDIDSSLRTYWSPIETPTVFVRDGDQVELSEEFRSRGFEIKPHPAGYRSVHYVFASQPLQRKVVVEVQVRTVFEEGWSEIDHRVRYPNFSDNALVAYFLTIFNRLAGSADEMGGFVKGLAATLSELQLQVTEATQSKEQSLRAMEEALGELERLRQQDAASQASVAKLKAEVAHLRRSASLETILSKKSDRDVLSGLGLGVDAAGLERVQKALQGARSLDLDHLVGARAIDLARLGIRGQSKVRQDSNEPKDPNEPKDSSDSNGR